MIAFLTGGIDNDIQQAQYFSMYIKDLAHYMQGMNCSVLMNDYMS